MRILSLLAVFAIACTSVQPGGRPIEMMQQQGLGAWIVLVSYDQHTLAGELIAVEPALVRVLTAGRLVTIGRGDIAGAKLYTYRDEDGVGVWGRVGAVSTISHGLWFVFSLPVWAAVMSIVIIVEQRHPILSYPDTSWDEMSKWSRFPQGLPVGLDPTALQ